MVARFISAIPFEAQSPVTIHKFTTLRQKHNTMTYAQLPDHHILIYAAMDPHNATDSSTKDLNVTFTLSGS